LLVREVEKKLYKYLTETIFIVAVLLALFLLWLYITLTGTKKSRKDLSTVNHTREARPKH
jgi:regulatory protein YycI of two-component signal transduction system YycFG